MFTVGDFGYNLLYYFFRKFSDLLEYGASAPFGFMMKLFFIFNISIQLFLSYDKLSSLCTNYS
eukprot:snap_masked-scaffold_14-processed-gene-8.2-mRNA-1 protein AED:1.00 eAED:1.00 QI:0/0/0/0/1/1/2/0/62